MNKQSNKTKRKGILAPSGEGQVHFIKATPIGIDKSMRIRPLEEPELSTKKSKKQTGLLSSMVENNKIDDRNV